MKKKLTAFLLCISMLFTACSAPETTPESSSGNSSVTSSVTEDDIETSSADGSQSEIAIPDTTTTKASETSTTAAPETTTTAVSDTTTTAVPETTTTVPETTTMVTTTESQTEVPRPELVVFPTANEVAKDMGLGISLGNTMEAYEATDCEKITFEWIPVVGNNTPKDYEVCWECVETTQEVIDGMKAAGFNTVRIPVFWGNMMANDGTWTINADYIARVKEIVDYCQNAGVYTVINIHHFDEFIIRRNDIDECEKIFTHLWTQIAEYFKDYGPTLVFEGYNEYLGGKQFNDKGELVELSTSDGYKMTNTMNQCFVDAVRKTGGNNAERVLIVSGYWTNIDLTTDSQFRMPTDTVSDRLMVSVHYVDNNMYWWNRIGSQDWMNYIDDQCGKLKRAFTDKGIPVFMGETTSNYPKDNMDASAKNKMTSTECLKIVLERLLDEGFVPVLWDTNSHFYSRTDYKINNADDAALIKSLSEKSAQ